ncbi:MAG: hypothetical protein EPN72_05355 [Nevskiaceae bacterium]|nr:MAG: hypothetical protein EPN63_03840 [Nevskiaceae bacterium]TBR73563.1 MAG: hypothetical protein EPN72_05355 [Nevskiaceae bacterium]
MPEGGRAGGQHFTGVVAALYDEARCLAPLSAAIGAEVALPGGRLVLSGMGALRATLAARRLVDVGATALLSWGTCGALDPALRAGDVVLPEWVTTEDGARHATDSAWGKRVQAALPQALKVVSGGALLSGDRTWTTPVDKARGAVFGQAVDMESAALAQVAEQAGISFLVIRAVVDEAAQSLPDAAVAGVDAIGRLRIGAFVAGLARRPRDVLALPALGRSFGHAAHNLRRIAACQPARLAFSR